jgi:hypothetical protein
MDELLKQVQEKTGLPADKAQDAIDAVLNFLSDKLPAPIAGQIEGFLDGGGGEAAGGGGAGDLMDKAKDALGGIGGLLGGDK